MLSLSTELGITLGGISKQGTYLQSDPINMELNIGQSRDRIQRRGYLRKLVKLPYAVCEEGSQWAETIENWLVGEVGFSSRIPHQPSIY